MSEVAHQHTWVRSLERKPYPHSRKLEYVKVVSTCSACGARSATAWTRHLKEPK